MSMSASPAAADDATASGGGIRELINRHAGIAVAAAIVVIALALLLNLRPTPKPEAYYTTDDGKTFFAAGPNIPPFEHDGKEAVKAIVFSCDGGKTKFVGYLMRFTPEGRKKAEEAMRLDRFAPATGFEVKRPGDKEWVPAADPQSLTAESIRAGALTRGRKYEEIMRVKCDNGQGAITYLPD